MQQWFCSSKVFSSTENLQLIRYYVCRLVGELLRLSDPVRVQYCPVLCAWHDGSGCEAVGLSLFRTLADALDTAGVCAVQRLLSARTAQTLQAGIAYIKAELSAGIANMVASIACEQ